jgi:putative protein kinase ArgK-like GTPase of G3E family
MEVWETIKSFEAHTKQCGSFAANRQHQRVQWLHQTIQSDLMSDFWNDPRIVERLAAVREQVESGDLYSGRAAQELVQLFRNR